MFSNTVMCGIERVVLEHHGDVAIRGIELVDDRAADRDLARRDVLQAGDHAQQRALAAARGADEDDELAVGDVEVDAVHDRDLAIRLADPVETDPGHCSRLSSHCLAQTIARTLRPSPAAKSKSGEHRGFSRHTPVPDRSRRANAHRPGRIRRLGPHACGAHRAHPRAVARRGGVRQRGIGRCRGGRSSRCRGLTVDLEALLRRPDHRSRSTSSRPTTCMPPWRWRHSTPASMSCWRSRWRPPSPMPSGVVAAAERSGRYLGVGLQLRVSRQWARVRELIAEGAIGRARYGNLTLFRRPFRPGSGGWRHTSDRVGSWILEELIHHIDLLLWYFRERGLPVEVSADGVPSALGAGMYDAFTCTLRFADGAYAVLSQCVGGFEHSLMLEIAGDGGALRTWWAGAMDRTLRRRISSSSCSAPAPRSRGRRHREIRRGVRAGGATPPPGRRRAAPHAAGFGARRPAQPQDLPRDRARAQRASPDCAGLDVKGKRMPRSCPR